MLTLPAEILHSQSRGGSEDPIRKRKYEQSKTIRAIKRNIRTLRTLTLAVKLPPNPTTSTRSQTQAGSPQASNVSMMEDRRTDPTTKRTISEQKAEELVAVEREPVGSEKEPKEIFHVVGAVEKEAGDKWFV